MWYFTKNGEITDGNVSISFNELATLLNGNSSGAFEIPAEKLGAVFTDNDLVYINQNDGLYYKAFKGASANQTQNVMGVYKATNGKHLIVTSGLVENFGTALVPGRRYYLSSTPGVVTDAIAYKSIVVGRAINNTNILLDISGDIDVGTWAGFDTTVVDGESKEGIGLTDPDATRSVSFNKVTYDDTLPAAIQFVDVNGTVIKLDVAGEYFGNPFTVTVGSDVYTGVFEENEAFDNPTQTTLVGGATAPEPEPEPTPEPEPEPEPTPEPEPEPTPEPVDAVNAYDTVLSGTQALNGVGLTDPNDGSDITISFDSIANDDSVPAEIMFLSVNGLVIKLDFQTEYTGKAIDAISAGVRYTGIISVNEDYSNPITLTAV